MENVKTGAFLNLSCLPEKCTYKNKRDNAVIPYDTVTIVELHRISKEIRIAFFSTIVK